MSLLTTPTPRNLEKKARLFGFELLDLLIIFLNLSLLNLLFGRTPYKYFLVWGTTVLLAAVLYFAKRNKPENYLQHLLRYYFASGVFHAGSPDVDYQPYQKENPYHAHQD